MPKTELPKLVLPPGLLSGLLFFAVVLAGAAYIVVAKLRDEPAVFVTLVPVCIMVAYALLLGFARFFRLRDDQSGDNLYYMGFLFTLTSLAVSLYQFRTDQGAADQIVQNFGIAIASTIAGIALRVFFNQMRRDPIEVEQTARLELADAARKVKRELESTALEFSHFRRMTQQSLAEAVEEINTQLKDAKDRIVAQLDEFATRSSKPLEEASKKSADRILRSNARISEAFRQLSQTTERITRALESIVWKLKHAEVQAKAVNENLRQTKGIRIRLTALLPFVWTAIRERAASITLESIIPQRKHAEVQAKTADDNHKTDHKSTHKASSLPFVPTAIREKATSTADISPPSEASVGLGDNDVRGPNA